MQLLFYIVKIVILKINYFELISCLDKVSVHNLNVSIVLEILLFHFVISKYRFLEFLFLKKFLFV